ncbi:universal stress protein [Rhodococcus xishaensis]|uniref:Universal stress protein n=1 Tax=Rhodococcus xishaensis TaxID=2487364 RepID=A0A438B075_9NOCA|nr:universal stress protein [Rhodococcus xishaensis]RVW04363.1 universal stress protein [Rhodococcus xishaensis]
MSTSPIVVGVDGSAASRDAVRWAAHEARLRGDTLLLLTSVSTGGIGPGSPFTDDLRIAGERCIDDARQLVALDNGGQVVDTRSELSPLPAVQALVEHSESARMIVLGTRGLGEFTSGLTGSVTSAVARHARCPVVVVPGWPKPGEPPLTGPVVVGADGSEASGPAIAAAFEEASLHDADLVALHAWSDRDLSMLNPFSLTDPHRIEWPTTEAAERAVLSESLAGWQEKYPDVTVRTIVVQDRPVHNLLTHGAGARLIVVGSRGRGGLPAMTLGSTSAALLHAVTNPLLVVRSK